MRESALATQDWRFASTFNCFEIVAHQRLFFGARPAFDLSLCRNCVGDLAEPLRIDQRHRQALRRVTAKVAAVVL
jgi:hypothetical protein